MNINKFIANSGYCSRRTADNLIKAGKVQINGKKADILDKVSISDLVEVDGKKISLKSKQKIYFAFNKPFGVISTTDQKSNNTIMNYIDIPERVYPIGRLDVKSKGLILLTNDGEIVNKILKSKQVKKEYLVKVDKPLSDIFLQKLRTGIMLEGRPTLPAQVEKVSSRVFKIVIVEGRKRQIRRMCERFHYNVLELIRTRIGKINLDQIEESKYKKIDPDKIYELLELTN